MSSRIDRSARKAAQKAKGKKKKINKGKREVINLMVRDYNLEKLGYDFMGYKIKKDSSISFHHLVVPRSRCIREGISQEGYLKWNGAILVQDPSHDYLHIIQSIDIDLFHRITDELVAINDKGWVDPANVKKIHGYLEQFEAEHREDTNKNGQPLIKKHYITDRHAF